MGECNFADEYWIIGYKLGVIEMKLKYALIEGGRENVKENYPEVTEEMLNDLTQMNREENFTEKYRDIILGMRIYEELEEEAWKELEKRKKKRRKTETWNAAVKFLEEEELITAESTPVAVCISLERMIPLDVNIKVQEEEKIETEDRIKLANYFLSLPECEDKAEMQTLLRNAIFADEENENEQNQNEQNQNKQNQNDDTLTLRHGHRVVMVRGNQSAFWRIVCVSQQQPWVIWRYNSGRRVIKKIKMNQYGEIVALEDY